MAQTPATKRGFFFIKVAISALLVWLLYRNVEFEPLKALLVSMDLRLVGVVLGFIFLNYVLSVYKWRCFLVSDGINLPFLELASSYIVGTFFNTFMPSSIGGDVVRVVDVARLSGRRVTSLASVFAERLSGFLALVTIGLIFALLAVGRLPDPRLVLLPIAVFLGIVVVTWMLVQQRLLRFILRLTRLDRVAKLNAFVDKFLASFDVYRRDPRLLVKVSILSIAFQVSVIVAIYFMARALRLDIPLFYFFVFVPLITLAEALPISVFGIGVRDASYVFFFSQVGVSDVEALSLSIFYVAVTLVYASIGGVVFAVRITFRHFRGETATAGPPA